MLKGRKTIIFWSGLIFCALSVCVLFAILWYNYVLNWFSWGYMMPFIFGSIVFLLVGLYMMISGVEKEDHNK
jgi:di/tricarboxylate transporter